MSEKMSQADPTTHFAPSERVTPKVLRLQEKKCLDSPIVQSILESVSGYLMVLNEQRQILNANEELLNALGVVEGQSVLGLRPGEALDCVHAAEGPAGCGTSPACAHCGAVLAILAAQADPKPATRECYLLFKKHGVLSSVEFKVRVSVLDLHGERLFLVIFQDISAQKRREVLEQIFFHNLRHELQSLLNWSEVLETCSGDAGLAARAILQQIQSITQQVNHQYLLSQAEHGRLMIHPTPVMASEILADLASQFSKNELLGLRKLYIVPVSEDSTITTDRALLHGVLVNMVMNALEATDPGGSVLVWHERHESKPSFCVQNPIVMPEHVVHRVFHRSFSTKKERGHGLGTFGMKLLGEHYLKGTVSFRSKPPEGTLFSIVLPER